MPELITDDGVAIYYQDFGDGVPIVFTCAGNATHAMWSEQVASLAREYRTIAWDWRGTGKSDIPRSGFTAEIAARDLCQLIERVLGAPAIVVGHGMGSHLALLAADDRPDLVRGLCLSDGGPWYSGDRDGVPGGMSDEFLSSFDAVAGASYADALMHMIDEHVFHTLPSDPVRYASLTQGLAWPQYVSEAYDAAMHDLDHRQRLGQIRCPTLVIHGRHDHKQRYEGGVYMAENIPGARLVTLEDSAHMGPTEEADAFAAALRELIHSSA